MSSHEIPGRWFTLLVTAAVAVLLVFAHVSHVKAADIPLAGPKYHIEGAIGSCGSQSFGSVESRTLSVAPIAAAARDVLLVVNPSRSPITQVFASGLIPPTDGSCLTSTITTAIDGPFTVYWRVTGIVRDSPTLSVEGAQQILTAALLLFAVAWGIRVASRIGTQHHD